MSGLIWASLGKGISDFGTVIGNAGIKQMEREELDRKEELREQRLLDREERRIALKEEAERTRTEREAQERADIAINAATRAEEKAVGRDAGVIGRIANQVSGDSPAMSQEEIKQLIAENPQYRDLYRKAGYIEDKVDPRLQRAIDEESAARELGAKPTLLEAYAKARKDVLSQIAEENRETNRERQLDQQGRKIDALITYMGQKGDAAVRTSEAAETRANRPTSSGSGGRSGGGDRPATVRSTQTDSNGNVIAIMSDGSKRDLGITSGDFNARVARTIQDREKNDSRFGKLDESEKRAWAISRLTGSGVSSSASEPVGKPATQRSYSNLWK